MEEKKVIRAAIIGSGQIARTSHIPAYRSMENVEIVAEMGIRDSCGSIRYQPGLIGRLAPQDGKRHLPLPPKILI